MAEQKLDHLKYLVSVIAGLVNGLEADENVTLAQREIARDLIRKFVAEMKDNLRSESDQLH